MCQFLLQYVKSNLCIVGATLYFCFIHVARLGFLSP